MTRFSFISAFAPRSWKWWQDEPPAPAQQQEDAMNARLRNIGTGQHGSLALKGFCDFHNFVVPNLMSEEAVIRRILKSHSSGISEAEARSAILKGFAAAKWRK
jgi:hypothetical protein